MDDGSEHGRVGGSRLPHVLFLGHGAERTGPPILLGHLLRGLAATGAYRLTVVTARPGPLLAEYGEVAEAMTAAHGREPLEPLAAAMRRAGAGRRSVAVQDRWLRRRLARVARPDLVYVNAATPPTAQLLRALDLDASVPVLLHVHELDIGLRLTLGHADRSLLFDRADAVVAVSEAAAELLRTGHGVSAERLATCPGFIDIGAVRPDPAARSREALGIPVDALVVGSVGLPDWRKAPDHLLHAVWHLRGAHPGLDPWVVWIGGDPASEDGRRLADEARRVGLGHRLRHVPHRDRPDRLLHALDVFALPAREDALPLAALEAAAAARPIVCFDRGGIAGLAERGAGAVVRYPDAAAFGEALALLLGDPAARTRLGERGRALVLADHDVAQGVAHIRDVIDRLLGP